MPQTRWSALMMMNMWKVLPDSSIHLTDDRWDLNSATCKVSLTSEVCCKWGDSFNAHCTNTPFCYVQTQLWTFTTQNLIDAMKFSTLTGNLDELLHSSVPCFHYRWPIQTFQTPLNPSVKKQNLLTGIHTFSYGINWLRLCPWFSLLSLLIYVLIL